MEHLSKFLPSAFLRCSPYLIVDRFHDFARVIVTNAGKAYKGTKITSSLPLSPAVMSYATFRDVAKDFNRRESSNNKRVLGERPTLACLLHAMPRGVRGHAPPGNFGKCILSETHFP